MDSIKDKMVFKPEFPYRIFISNSRQMNFHSHDFLEINYVISGTGFYLIEEKEYEICEGDIFIINNLERHMAVHDGSLQLKVIVFDPAFFWDKNQGYQFLEPFFNRSPNFTNRIRPSQEGYIGLQEDLEHICDEYAGKHTGWELFVKSWTQLFLARLYRFYIDSCLEEDFGRRHKPFIRLQPVLDYIHEHYMEQLELDEMAKVAMMNKSYLCSCFKNILHMRIFEYIDQLRINQACMLLTTTEMNITEIAMKTGFNSVSYFNRIFKKVQGVSPGTYRKIQI